MEYFGGETLQAAWAGHLLSSAEKKGAVEGLADYIRRLRLLGPPQRGAVASAEFKPCLDYQVGLLMEVAIISRDTSEL
jgi:hypothetical protein